jgi:site-specific DNA-methyltransferase (adenine-specific)
LYKLLNVVGFKTTRLVGLWVKPSGQTMNPGIRLASAYEPFFWARKGEPALARQGAINVWPFSPVSSTKKTHPTERPLELMSSIISTFAFPKSRVLVPFAGSGVSLLAAAQLGMLPLGFDLTQQYKESFTVKVMEMFR